MRYFKLLKDLPELKVESIFELGADSERFYASVDKSLEGTYTAYKIEIVENSPEWFVEVWKCEKCGKFFSPKTVSGECVECHFNPEKENKIEKINKSIWVSNDKLFYNYNILIDKMNEMIDKLNERL